MKLKLLLLTVSVILVFTSGCKPKNAPPTPEPTQAPVTAETQAPIAEATSDPAAATDAPAAETAAPVEITHLDIPGFPQYSNDQKVDDCNTGERFNLGATTLIGSGCDDWNISKLERPMDAPNGVYFPAADIISTRMGTNQVWYFAKVDLYKDAKGNIPADLVIGLELDTDIDSRGEILILVSGAASTEWSVSGVSVWEDSDGDVGGEKPQVPDAFKGNGYDKLIFESGIGEDPDLAWARIDPVSGSAVEIAFKPSLVPANGKFAWWTWTSLTVLDSAKMEVVDQFESTQVWRLDNTCGWIFGAKPSKLLLNICEYFVPTATPAPTPTPQGCVTRTDEWCNENADPQNGGFPWWWDAASCSCKPTN